MERFTIGCSRNGKIITSHPDLDGFSTYEEIFDAMAVLSLLAVREIRRDKSSDIANHLVKEARILVRALHDADQWHSQMQAIGAETVFDIQNYAARLLRPEFRV